MGNVLSSPPKFIADIVKSHLIIQKNPQTFKITYTSDMICITDLRVRTDLDLSPSMAT